MSIQQATTEMGTFYYLAEDACIGSMLGCGRAWEPEVLDAVRPPFRPSDQLLLLPPPRR